MKFNRLKEKYNYYRNLTDYRLTPNSYVMVMLNDRSFSKKIKKCFERPFSKEFINIMNNIAKYLCEKVGGCKIAYVQSDEITLILKDAEEQHPFFANRLCKLQSIIASMATSKFNQLMILNNIRYIPCSKEDVVDIIENDTLYEFDCKVWNVPNINDAFASIIYRQNDCIRNSNEAEAQFYFSQERLNCKTTDEQIEMVKALKDVDWKTKYSNCEKYDRLIMKYTIDLEKERESSIIYKRRLWAIREALPLDNAEFYNEIINYLENDENTKQLV